MERVNECTSGLFQGIIGMMNPNDSWVAKWQRIDKYQKGLYAIRVQGQLPEEVQLLLEQKGIVYRPRDQLAS